MKQGFATQNDQFDEGLQLVCVRISAVSKANPPPYIHCSKINNFLQNIKEIAQLIRTHRYDTPKRLSITIKNHFQGFISILEQFQQIHTHCCRDTCAQFALTTSMKDLYNEFFSMRKEAAKHLETLGLLDAAQKMIIPESELQSQNQVDVKRISIIIKQLRRRKDAQIRSDVMKHLDCRTASLTELGVSLDDEDSEIITVPELPTSLNFVLQPDDLEFLGEMIGSGQSGRVFRGYIKSTHEEVAIKVLHSRMLTSTDLDMFRREIFTMAVISHPMLVKFYGYTTDSPFCIVTEYMSNGSLYDFLKEHGEELTPTERTLIALDVARGMEYLHSRGIIHRDLKSLNVLLDSKKRGRICDFGLSRIKSSAPMTGLIGTTLWMAPEVLLSTPFYDEKVDVYSFGILLWELVTGLPPYNNEVSTELTRQIVEQNRRPPIPPDTPTPLKKLIESCWEGLPSKRPSFHQIVADLSDPSYQIPGSERMTFLKEAGLNRRNHTYSSSSPLSLNMHEFSFRTGNNFKLMNLPVNDNAVRAVQRIGEAINSGHMEHFANSLIQLRASSRARDVDWPKVIPAFINVYDNSPTKFKPRLLQVFFDLLARPGAIDCIDPEFIVRILKITDNDIKTTDNHQVISSHDNEINNVLINLNYQIFPKLFQESVVRALLGLSRHPQQTIRIKALSILFDVSKHTNQFNNIEFINGLLNFSMRKLPEHVLDYLLSSVRKLLQQINSIDNKIMEKLTKLMIMLHGASLLTLSSCIEECFKFETVMTNFSAQIWLNSVTNFDSFSSLFIYFRESLPNNYPEIANALCLASESSDDALDLLISFCKIHECMVLETSRRLPLGNTNYRLLADLYFIIIDFDDVLKMLTSFYEFYAVSPFLLASEKVDKVCAIYRNYQLNLEYLTKSNVCETIANLYLSTHQQSNLNNDNSEPNSIPVFKTSSSPIFSSPNITSLTSLSTHPTSLFNQQSSPFTPSSISAENQNSIMISDSVANTENPSILSNQAFSLSSMAYSAPLTSRSPMKTIEKHLLSLMTLIFTISCQANIPAFRGCISDLFDILGTINTNSLNEPQSLAASATTASSQSTASFTQSRNDVIVHSAFLCLCVLAKFDATNFDVNLLILSAARYVHNDNQITQDAACFTLTALGDTITNLDSVINTFLSSMKNEKQGAVLNFAKILVKLAEKYQPPIPKSYINRLNKLVC